MPRYEYIDHEGNAHVIAAQNLKEARMVAWVRENRATENLRLADQASGTVEQSDERSRAA